MRFPLHTASPRYTGICFTEHCLVSALWKSHPHCHCRHHGFATMGWSRRVNNITQENLAHSLCLGRELLGPNRERASLKAISILPGIIFWVWSYKARPTVIASGFPKCSLALLFRVLRQMLPAYRLALITSVGETGMFNLLHLMQNLNLFL